MLWRLLAGAGSITFVVTGIRVLDCPAVTIGRAGSARFGALLFECWPPASAPADALSGGQAFGIGLAAAAGLALVALWPIPLQLIRSLGHGPASAGEARTSPNQRATSPEFTPTEPEQSGGGQSGIRWFVGAIAAIGALGMGITAFVALVAANTDDPTQGSTAPAAPETTLASTSSSTTAPSSTTTPPGTREPPVDVQRLIIPDEPAPGRSESVLDDPGYLVFEACDSIGAEGANSPGVEPYEWCNALAWASSRTEAPNFALPIAELTLAELGAIYCDGWRAGESSLANAAADWPSVANVIGRPPYSDCRTDLQETIPAAIAFAMPACPEGLFACTDTVWPTPDPSSASAVWCDGATEATSAAIAQEAGWDLPASVKAAMVIDCTRRAGLDYG